MANLDPIVSLSKRRGFVFPSSEIYGGINAVWDYGPLGVELKNNVKRAWWRAMVQERDDIVGLDAGILLHPQVWITSGHVGSFSDPLVECATCHRRYRLDVQPGGPAAAAAFAEWLPRRRAWYEAYGVTPARLRLREHAPGELAHYARKAIDIEYRFPFGWKELEGVHNRGDFDLSRHAEASGDNLEYFDQATEEHFLPWVVETAAGADRAAFTFLIDAYREEEVRGETRVSLALHPQLAPYKVAVLPLLKKRPEIVQLCHRIKDDLRREVMAVYDDTAAIGKLYRRQDEIGTPWCVTVDVDSLEDGAVTIRERDSMTQERVGVDQVKRVILDRLTAARP